MKILVPDNYGLFTHNLCDKILPFPGLPSEEGILPQVIMQYSPTKSIFGLGQPINCRNLEVL